jgi:hypothetical protein
VRVFFLLNSVLNLLRDRDGKSDLLLGSDCQISLSIKPGKIWILGRLWVSVTNFSRQRQDPGKDYFIGKQESTDGAQEEKVSDSTPPDRVRIRFADDVNIFMRRQLPWNIHVQ